MSIFGQLLFSRIIFKKWLLEACTAILAHQAREDPEVRVTADRAGADSELPGSTVCPKFGAFTLQTLIQQSIVASSESVPTSVRGASDRNLPEERISLQTCIRVALFLHFPMKSSSRPWSVTTLTNKDEFSSHRNGLQMWHANRADDSESCQICGWLSVFAFVYV